MQRKILPKPKSLATTLHTLAWIRSQVVVRDSQQLYIVPTRYTTWPSGHGPLHKDVLSIHLTSSVRSAYNRALSSIIEMASQHTLRKVC